MEKILSEIKNTADKVAKKSGELVELSKVKINILNTKSSIDSYFKKLGEILYFSQKEDADADTENLEEIFAKIDELYEKLSEYNDAKANLTNKKICPECHKSNDTDSSFCSRCGYNFAD